MIPFLLSIKKCLNRINNSWKSWPNKRIVAGLIDEIGVVEVINQKLGVDNREKITTGEVIKALIFNGLGMVLPKSIWKCKYT